MFHSLLFLKPLPMVSILFIVATKIHMPDKVHNRMNKIILLFSIFVVNTGPDPGPEAVYDSVFALAAIGALVCLLLILCIIYKTRCRCIRRLCRKKRIGHSDASIEAGMDDYYPQTDKRDAPPGVFIARKPVKLGPIIEPYLEPPPKVELLYDIEPRPSSSRLMFSRSVFLSQLSLKLKE